MDNSQLYSKLMSNCIKEMSRYADMDKYLWLLYQLLGMLLCSGINKTHSSTGSGTEFLWSTLLPCCLDKDLIVQSNSFALCFPKIGIFLCMPKVHDSEFRYEGNLRLDNRTCSKQCDGFCLLESEYKFALLH